MRTTLLSLLLSTCASELLLTRHTTATGGHQARTSTSTDYITHFCHNTTLPLAVRGCGADVNTGGNPGPRDPATPMNLILQCSGSEEALICGAPGNNITDMCCEAVLPQGFAAGCVVVLRVFNGGSITVTLVTGQVDAWAVVVDDIARLPRALMTTPTLPRAPQDQVRPLLTSVASLSPITVPFNDRRREMVDLGFFFCGESSQVTFGVGGTTLSAESEVFVCEKEMGELCGNQLNHGTDNVVTTFHSVVSKTLQYGREYFIRVFSYGHEGGQPTINITLANTVVPLPRFVMDTYFKNAQAN